MGILAKNVYAIAVSPFYVELRAANEEPIGLVSKLLKTVPVKRGDYIINEDGRHTYVSKRGKQKILFTQTTYTGGKIIAYVKTHRFYTVFRQFSPPHGKMILLNQENARNAQSALWRKKHLEG